MSDAAGTISWRRLWAEAAESIADRESARRLRIGEHRQVARWLCETASGRDAEEFLEILDDPATQRAVAHLDAMVERVKAGEPLQYVLGRWGFRRLDLMVDRRVLIPRPETEQVVDAALALARAALEEHGPPLRLADLGTGSGAIGLALVSELPLAAALVWLTDVSQDALDVATANSAGVGRAASGVRISRGSWCDALPADERGRFDMIVANPPYVATDGEGLEPIVRDWEPHVALFGGRSGLDHISVIATEAMEWLRPGGALVLEISGRHGVDVSTLLRERGYVDVEILADLAGLDRIAQAKRAAT